VECFFREGIMPKQRRTRDVEGLTKRGRIYWADFRHRGERIRESLKTANRRVAAEKLIELRSRLQRGDYGLLDDDCLIVDLKEKYLQHCEQTLKPGTVENYRHHIATVNAELRSVGIMFNWGVDPARIIASNPMKGIKPIPDDTPKEGRALDATEVAALLNASPAYWRDVWLAFLLTGCRKNELVQLRFDDIDRESRELVIRRGVAKNHNARRLPIDDVLWDILKRLEAERQHRQPIGGKGRNGVATRERFSKDHVFVSKMNTPLDGKGFLYATFMRHCEKASICVRTERADGVVEHVDLHGLRRTSATALIVGGNDPKTVQELLGHKTLEMTMNLYTKIHTGTKRQALDCLPWGRGSTSPDHLVEYPGKAKDGHVLSTVPIPVAVSR